MKSRYFLNLFLLLFPFVFQKGSAADSGVDIVMTLQQLQVTHAGGQSLNVPVAKGQNQVLGRAILRNTGNGNQNYALKIASTTGTWAPVTGTPGVNQYRLSAIWHAWNQAPASANYASNDIVTSANQISSSIIFARTAGPDSDKGFNVPPFGEANNPNWAGERSLYFKVQGPPSGNGSAIAHVTVTALAAE